MPASVFTESSIDVAALLADGLPANEVHQVIPRGPKDTWLVAMSPWDIAQPVKWGLVRDGTHVRIPLVPYDTHQDALKAIKFALMLGLRAGLDIQLSRHDIVRLHLVTSQVIDDVTQEAGWDAFRFWVGVAVQTH